MWVDRGKSGRSHFGYGSKVAVPIFVDWNLPVFCLVPGISFSRSGSNLDNWVSSPPMISNGWGSLDGDGFFDELLDDWTELGVESSGFGLDSGQVEFVSLSKRVGQSFLGRFLERISGGFLRRFSNNSVSWNSIISFFVFSSSQFWIESDL